MAGKKQSRQDHLEIQVKALTRALNGLMGEVENIRNLSVGTLETVKMLPDYQKALSALQEKYDVEITEE